MPPTFVFVLLIVAITVGGGMPFKAYQLARNAAHAERMQRLKVLEDALRNPATDLETRQQLIQAVQADTRSNSAWGNWINDHVTPRRFFGALAWLMIVYGSVLLGLGIDRNTCDAGGLMAVALGLGILALPHVFRELDARALKH
jgi:hypothetical protein